MFVLQENLTTVETPLIYLATLTAQTRTLVSQTRLLMVDQATKLQMVLENLGRFKNNGCMYGIEISISRRNYVMVTNIKPQIALQHQVKHFFQLKTTDIFLFSPWKRCRYSLEVSHQGASDEYPQYVFLEK